MRLKTLFLVIVMRSVVCIILVGFQAVGSFAFCRQKITARTNFFMSKDTQSTSHWTKALELNSMGNSHLRNGEIDSAIRCYSEALRLDSEPHNQPVVLVMRSTAYLQRAFDLKMRYRDACRFMKLLLPQEESIQAYSYLIRPLPEALRYEALKFQLGKVGQIHSSMDLSPAWGAAKGIWQEQVEGEPPMSSEAIMSRVAYLWHMYESAIYSALEDSLSATVLSPELAPAWRRAGDAFSELEMHARAAEYYATAVIIDPSLEDVLRATIARAKRLANEMQR